MELGDRSAGRRRRGKSFPQPSARPLIYVGCRLVKNSKLRKLYMAKLLIFVANSAVLKTGGR